LPEHACEDESCTTSRSGFGLGRLPAFLVLSVPIALATILSPDKYGSVMVRNRGTADRLELADSPVTSKPSVVSSKPTAVEVGDLLIAAQSKSGMAQYDGKCVELVGQFCPLGDKDFEVVRMLMLCCAADAQILAVRAESDRKPAIQSMQWVNVVGRVSFAKKGDRDVPFIAAEHVAAVSEPADRFVYRGGTRPSAPMHKFKLQLPPH